MKLFDYQHRAVEFLTANPFAALFLDMGLGKTVISLTALAEALDRGDARRALVIAPLKVAVNVWGPEIRKWPHTKHVTYTLIRAFGDEPEVAEAIGISKVACRVRGLNARAANKISARAATRAEERVRERLLRQKTQVHIINREAVPWLVRKWGSKWPYDTIVYDESSALRDRSTQQVKALAHARKKLTRMWQLTGTPAPETYHDLFPQIYLLDQGERFGRGIGAFRDRYFTYNPNKHKYFLRKGMERRIAMKIADLVLPMRAEDYLPINRPAFVDRTVSLPERLQEQYEQLAEEFVIRLADGADIFAEAAGALGQKLLQFASGSIYDDEGKSHWVHDEKIDVLRELIEEAHGQNIIVAYGFRSSLARLKQAFPKGRAMDRDGRLESEWTAGRVPLMFLHPRSAGHGLNLQYGGHILVYFDTPWSGEAYIQTVARIARQGQTHVPQVFHIVMERTIDTRIVPELRRKLAGQDGLFADVKDLRNQFEGDQGL